MPDKHGPCYVFDEFTLDLRRGCLLRAGERVSLRPKAFDALRYLVEHRGELASKDALVRALWPRSVVTDDSLVKCIQEIREALGDKQHRYVKTVPRRGYLFDVPVEVRASEPSGEAGSSGESAPVGSAGPAAGDSGEAARRRVGRGRFGWPVAVAAAAVVVAGSAAYYFLGGESRPAQASPSIAVLPFLNLSSEPEQEYFSDGLAEETAE